MNWYWFRLVQPSPVVTLKPGPIPLGTGSVGEVLEGTLSDGSLVVIKMACGSPLDLNHERELYARFWTSADRDPNGNLHVMPYLGWCDRDSLLAREGIVMPKCCFSLCELLEHEDSIDYLELVDWVEFARHIACGLNELHKARIVHRDLMTSNVFMLATKPEPAPGQCYHWVVGDLSHSCGMDEATAVERSPSRWHSLELLMNPALVSKEDDVYQFGGLVFKMMTGEALFSAFSDEDVLDHRQAHPSDLGYSPEQATAMRERCPGLWAIVERCLRPVASDRPSTEEVYRELCALEVSRTPVARDAFRDAPVAGSPC